ncbi:Hypothetical protein HVR_LOCUS614 [uncultured virus]|nr:Hypothetical protein HVR_LOCUS614 [uncultured virus]
MDISTSAGHDSAKSSVNDIIIERSPVISNPNNIETRNESKRLRRKDRRRKQKAKKRNLLLSLPIELILHICEFLEDYDLVSFALVNKRSYGYLHDNIHTIRHKCLSLMENAWNYMAREADDMAHQRLDQHKSRVCSGWEVVKTDSIECCCFKNVYHQLKVIYVYNPRDVDLVAWYEDGIKIGYNML